MRRISSGLVWVGLGAILLVGCSKESDTSKIEAILKTELEKQNGIALKAVKCPQKLQADPGKEFECTGELNPEGGFFIQVKASGETDKVDWDIPHSWRLLNLAKLETEFQQVLVQAQSTNSAAQANAQSDRTDKSKPPLDLKVSCGGGYRVVKPGDSFECQLVSSKDLAGQNKPSLQVAKKPDVIAVKVESDGNVTWQEIREAAAASVAGGPAIDGKSTPSQAAIGVPPGQSPPTTGTGASPSPATLDTGILESAPRDETGWQELGD